MNTKKNCKALVMQIRRDFETILTQVCYLLKNYNLEISNLLA